MSVYAEALALVTLLLEATVRVRHRGVVRDVEAVPLAPVTQWTSFITHGAHGLANFAERVDDDDMADFCDAMQRLTRAAPGVVLVPARDKWALKMPGGYVIFGTGNMGITCSAKRETIAADQQLIERNPILTDLEHRQWDMVRGGL